MLILLMMKESSILRARRSSLNLCFTTRGQQSLQAYSLQEHSPSIHHQVIRLQRTTKRMCLVLPQVQAELFTGLSHFKFLYQLYVNASRHSGQEVNAEVPHPPAQARPGQARIIPNHLSICSESIRLHANRSDGPP